MIKIFRTLFAVVVLIGIAYLVTNYSGQIQKVAGIKGAGTNKAQGIAGQVLGDATSQVNNAKNQAMHINLSQILNGLSKYKQIPQEANSIKEYTQTQITNMLQSRNKK